MHGVVVGLRLDPTVSEDGGNTFRDVCFVVVPEGVFVDPLGAFAVAVDVAPNWGDEVRVEDIEHAFLELESLLPLIGPFACLTVIGLVNEEHFKSSSGKVTLNPINGSPPAGITTLLSSLSIFFCIYHQLPQYLSS